MPSKHAQNEDEKHFNSTNRSTQELIRAIYVFGIQGPQVLSTNSNKNGIFKENDIINITKIGIAQA